MEMFKGGDFHKRFFSGLNQKFSGHNGFKTEDVLVPQGLVAGFNPYGLMLVSVFLCVCIPRAYIKRKGKPEFVVMPRAGGFISLL